MFAVRTGYGELAGVICIRIDAAIDAIPIKCRSNLLITIVRAGFSRKVVAHLAHSAGS